MSFTTKVKEDLTHIMSSKPCCRKAEFLAFFLINGNMRLAGGLSLVMQTENSAAARKMYSLAKEFDLEREVSIYRRSRLKKNQVYRLIIPAQTNIRPLLTQLGLVDAGGGWQLGQSQGLLDTFLREPCCRRAYLRGAFLAAGSVSDPDSGSYHLEIDSLDADQAQLLLELLAHFGLAGKLARRRSDVTLYLKGAEQISDFMNIVGSHRSLLEFESVRVTRDVRNQANRLRNCDTANVNKTVAAALRQMRDIAYIQSNLGLEKLPRPLRQVAELRLENSDASLAELALLSGLGRSALNHRLRRLSQIAERIRDFGPEAWDQE